ncbi:MAG: hypothetical protein LBI64_05925 [Coriobacteriales bacterium]|jgi:hypothetical protein|nr:hypothetical protein [Coriobacteriales bacterium]
MTSITAYYDGLVFVPVEPVDIVKGTVIQLSVIRENIFEAAKAEKMASFRRLNNGIHELNCSEPLSNEFDQVLASRVSFNRELDL